AGVGRAAARSVGVGVARGREGTLIGDDGTGRRRVFLIDWLRRPTMIRGRVCHLASGVPSSACPGQGWGRLTSRERIGLALFSAVTKQWEPRASCFGSGPS